MYSRKGQTWFRAGPTRECFHARAYRRQQRPVEELVFDKPIGELAVELRDGDAVASGLNR